MGLLTWIGISLCLIRFFFLMVPCPAETEVLCIYFILLPFSFDGKPQNSFLPSIGKIWFIIVFIASWPNYLLRIVSAFFPIDFLSYAFPPRQKSYAFQRFCGNSCTSSASSTTPSSGSSSSSSTSSLGLLFSSWSSCLGQTPSSWTLCLGPSFFWWTSSFGFWLLCSSLFFPLVSLMQSLARPHLQVDFNYHFLQTLFCP